MRVCESCMHVGNRVTGGNREEEGSSASGEIQQADGRRLLACKSFKEQNGF